MTSQSVILCEGYHDRSFIAGWLIALGCRDCREADLWLGKDPWGKPVRNSEFGYTTDDNRFIRIVPCNSRDNIFNTAKRYLKRRTTEPVERLLLVCDRDDYADGTPADPNRITARGLHSVLTNIVGDDTLVRNEKANTWQLGITTIALLHWCSPLAEIAELPNKQTLERLVCGVFSAVHPERCQAVSQWLISRPDATQPQAGGPKEHVWSHMAAWYAEHGCDAFWRQLWEDDPVANRLREELNAIGIYSQMQALVDGAQ